MIIINVEECIILFNEDVKLIKGDSKDIHNVTKDFYFK